jgi:hypothetical protein
MHYPFVYPIRLMGKIIMGKEGLEPSRLAAHDPKSCLSANSSTSPRAGIISEREMDVNKSDIIIALSIIMLTVFVRSASLGRIIKTGSAGKDRLLFEKGIVVAIRELTKQTDLNETTYDLVAYIALSLKAIGNTIDVSVAAWEKRDYWLKADRYRMEWNWTSKLGDELEIAILKEDWGNVTRIIAQVTQRMSKVNVAQRNRLGTPWVGSWDRLKRPNHHH